MRLGNPQIPEQADGVHNALADARHNKVIADFLDAYAAGRSIGEKISRAIDEAEQRDA